MRMTMKMKKNMMMKMGQREPEVVLRVQRLISVVAGRIQSGKAKSEESCGYGDGDGCGDGDGDLDEMEIVFEIGIWD